MVNAYPAVRYGPTVQALTMSEIERKLKVLLGTMGTVIILIFIGLQLL